MPRKINRPSAGLIRAPDVQRRTSFASGSRRFPANRMVSMPARHTSTAPAKDRTSGISPRNTPPMHAGVLEPAAQQQLARVGMKISLAHEGRVGKAPEIMPEQRQRRRERRLAAPIGMNHLDQFGH